MLTAPFPTPRHSRRAGQLRFARPLFFCSAILALSAGIRADEWWPANDAERIERSGAWEWKRHRYAAESALETREDGASLTFEFRGRTLVLAFDTLE